jgi:cytochrome c oxidase subunit 4
MGGNGHHGELGHIVPFKTYVTVLSILIFLTIVTVWVSQYDFGTMNMVVAMGVASIKALLVALFFMHLKYEHPLTWLYAAFPMLLLAILVGSLFIDNPYRVSQVGEHSPADQVVSQ